MVVIIKTVAPDMQVVFGYDGDDGVVEDFEICFLFMFSI